MNEIKYFSMFTGVGGFEVGFTNSSEETQGERDKESREDSSMSNGESSAQGRSKPTYRCVGQSEWDKYSSQVLKYRFPEVKNWGDCTKIRPEDLPDFDMLCGGFPCQAFSIAGKRRGFEDIRGTMFFEVARILKVKRPKTILLENVKGLLNHAKGETFRVIIQTLDELGYEVQWMVLNSKFFGVPQNRERVLIIGNLRGTSRPEILPFGGSDSEIALKQIIPGGQGNRVYSTEGVSSTIASQAGGRGAKTGLYAIMDLYNKKEHRDRSPTLTEPHHNTLRVREGIKIRRLTPIECCRLQGFPDDWNEYGTDEKGEVVKMSDTQRYKQMGNAVTTNVVAAIGSSFLNKESQDE